MLVTIIVDGLGFCAIVLNARDRVISLLELPPAGCTGCAGCVDVTLSRVCSCWCSGELSHRRPPALPKLTFSRQCLQVFGSSRFTISRSEAMDRSSLQDEVLAEDFIAKAILDLVDEARNKYALHWGNEVSLLCTCQLECPH